MAEPGWYPDPAGRPRHFRYWDGQQWGVSTTSAPAAPDPKKPNFRLVTVVVILGLVALVIGGWAAIGGTSGGADPSPSPTPIGRQDDGPLPRSTPTPSPEPTPSPTSPTGGTSVPCPVVDYSPAEAAPGGELASAGLMMRIPDGWQTAPGRVNRGLTRQSAALRHLESSTWLSFLSLGIAPHAAGFDDPRLTAQQLFQCHVTGSMFSGLTSEQTQLDEAITIDGARGWRMRLHADSDTAPGGGATYDLIVLDTGDEEGLSVFWSGVIDADTEALRSVEKAIPTLRVG